MTFGIARGVAQDAAGNLQTNVWIEVRRMAPGYPLAVPIYADADGASGQDNPFFSSSGEFAFYAVGGLYRVRVYRAGFDKIWDNVPVGTAQAADVDAYARAGFTWAPESATGTPPTAGCIRFDNADISLAQHVYLDKDTLGGSDASSWLNSMAPGDWLLLSTGVGIETGWQVVAITDHTGWFDFEVDDGSYAGPAGPLSFGDSGFVTVSQQRNGSIDAGTGVLVQTGPNAYVARTITGTANEVVVANGSGVAGNPTLSLPAALTFTGKTVTGGTFASPTAITGLPDPTNAQDAATKSYVDNLAAGLDIKGSARAATTANITLSGTQTIDGVSVVAGERVLVKNQSTASQNGIYVVAAGAWARSGDMNAWTEVPGATLWVEEGSTLADTAWVCTSNAGGTIGSTAIIWTQFGGTGAFQGLNANLTAIAGLTTAADKLSYWTGAGTAGLTDLSSFARTLLDDVSAGAARTTLGVAIGSDVQGYNSQLANIAAVTPAQGDLLYYNGAAWVKLAAGTSGNFLKTQGISANPVWASVPGGGDMLAANNLSDVASVSSARANLGLAYATIAPERFPTLSNNSSDPTNDIDFTAASLWDSTFASRASIAAMTKRLDATWSAGSGNGMRSSADNSGSIANKTYHLFAGWKAGAANPDWYADGTPNEATALGHWQAEIGGGGYVYAQRVGSIVRASASILGFVQVGDIVKWKTVVNDRSSTAAFSTALLTVTVPTGINVQPLLHVAIDATGATTYGFGSAAQGGADLAAAAYANNGFVRYYLPPEWTTNTSAQLYFSQTNISGTPSVSQVNTMGYVDARGRP